MEMTLLKVTVVVYLLATASFIVYVVLLKEFFARLSPLILLAGFVIHTSALGVHFVQTGYPAIMQFREALSFYSWLMVGIYLLVQLRYRLVVLGCFIGPLAALKTYWLPLHVTLAFLGNAVFALAFGVSLMYLLQEYQLKSKKMPSLYQRFPSLETLDRLNYLFLVWGFPLMTLGIITGSMWAGVHWGKYWSWDPRQISSAVTWLLYGTLLQGRIAAGWRGKKAAVLTIVGFAVVLGYFLWGDYLFPSRHGGRFE
ncbi:MAG: cytochrome c biogenesis protein CcsA [Deltaproteobacteria bacterium]|nr:cytochrome c biogenesis protein CcsA [Deltaproteobacteria bacterium]